MIYPYVQAVRTTMISGISRSQSPHERAAQLDCRIDLHLKGALQSCNLTKLLCSGSSQAHYNTFSFLYLYIVVNMLD